MGKRVTNVTKVLRKIPPAWQVFIIMLGLAGIGAKVAGYVGLPEQVEANSAAIHQLQLSQEEERNLLLRMLCNQDPTETFETCERQYSGINGARRY